MRGCAPTPWMMCTGLILSGECQATLDPAISACLSGVEPLASTGARATRRCFE